VGIYPGMMLRAVYLDGDLLLHRCSLLASPGRAAGEGPGLCLLLVRYWPGRGQDVLTHTQALQACSS
jgi:hypothetical protein